MSNKLSQHENPYAAPQATLHELPSGLTTMNRPNYLRQGIVAGAQLGGLASFFIVTVYLGTWDKHSTINKLILIPAITMLAVVIIGVFVGGTVQLVSKSLANNSIIPRLEQPPNEDDDVSNYK
jgi:hypothetical protein